MSSSSSSIRYASVSVVVPTFNNSGTLARAVRSVLDQTIGAREIIVVDDGSTDGTDWLGLAAIDPRIVIVRHHRREGGSAARNTGIDRATADLIAFLDADDIWFPTKLERQLALADDQPGGDFVVASNCLLGEDPGAPVHNRRPPHPGEPVSHYLLVAGGALQTSTLLMPTAVARAVRFRPGLRRHQDWDFVIRLAAEGIRLIYDQEALSLYDVSDRSGRVSQQDQAFMRTVEWFHLVRPLVPAAYMQHYFVTQCFSSASIAHPLSLLRAFLWICWISPRTLPALLPAVVGVSRNKLRRRIGRRR